MSDEPAMVNAIDPEPYTWNLYTEWGPRWETSWLSASSVNVSMKIVDEQCQWTVNIGSYQDQNLAAVGATGIHRDLTEAFFEAIRALYRQHLPVFPEPDGAAEPSVSTTTEATDE